VATNWQYQTYHHKWHGIVVIYVLPQRLGPKVLGRSVDKRI
jgi:hypothetical protein